MKTKRSMANYTTQMAVAMDNHRISNLWNRKDFYEKMGVSAQLMLHYEKTGKISFKTLKLLKSKGLNLLPYVKKADE